MKLLSSISSVDGTQNIRTSFAGAFALRSSNMVEENAASQYQVLEELGSTLFFFWDLEMRPYHMFQPCCHEYL